MSCCHVEPYAASCSDSCGLPLYYVHMYGTGVRHILWLMQDLHSSAGLNQLLSRDITSFVDCGGWLPVAHQSITFCCCHSIMLP